MKRIGLLLLACVLFIVSFAKRPTNWSANYIGENMWNTKEMVPYSGLVSLEIKDSLAYLKHNSSERVDTFIYDCPYNNGYRYIRQVFRGFWEFLLISEDTLKLQVGEPKEVNYFYKLESINSSTICPECCGTGEVLCPRCQGTGRISPKKNGSPDEAVGICPFCHGSRTITHSPCRRCNGDGKIVRKIAKHNAK